MELMWMFLVSLGLTLVIELLVAWLFGIRSPKGILLVALVNILTNPAAVACVWGAGVLYREIPRIVVEIIVEVIVLLVECGIYKSFSQKEEYHLKKVYLFAFLANFASWGTGLVFQNLL